MTENEALKLLKKANRDNDMVCILPKSDMGKCLVKALEKQMPFKPAKNKYALGIVKFRCKCGTEYLYKATKYCVNCGQYLDRSEKE